MRRPPSRVPPGARRAVPLAPTLPLLLLALALVVITFAAFAGALSHGFVNWDDMQYVGENPLVLGKHYGQLLHAVVSHHYHPLTMLSLAWNVSTPLSAQPFVATSVGLHLLNTLLVFWLVLLLARGRWPVAAFVALLFGIHPMHVESVAWVSERKDVLYTFFFLGGLIAYWKYLERRGSWLLGLAFVLFVLSCLSKVMAIVFPAVLVLLDYWRGRPALERRAALEKLPFLAVSLLFGLIVQDVQAGGDFHGLLRIVRVSAGPSRALMDVTPLQRILLPTNSYLMYVWQLFVPAGLCALYPQPPPHELVLPPYVLAPLFLLGTLALAFWDLRRTRVIAFGLGWYLVTIAPVLRYAPQSIPIGGGITADRYSYLSYIGLLFVLGMGLQAVFERRRFLGVALWGVSGLFAAALWVQTVHQVETWKNSEALWSRVIQVNPRLGAAFVLRGKDRFASGQTPAAMRDFQTAHRFGLRTADLYEGLGSGWVALGKLDSALVMFDRAVAADPGRGRSYYNRAAVGLSLGRPREALGDLDRALALIPAEGATLYAARGYARMQLQEYREAAADLDRAVAAGGGDTQVRYNRGFCRLQLGDRAGAVDDFREALRLNPGNAGAQRQLRTLGL